MLPQEQAFHKQQAAYSNNNSFWLIRVVKLDCCSKSGRPLKADSYAKLRNTLTREGLSRNDCC
jgi:hypothetical protein